MSFDSFDGFDYFAEPKPSFCDACGRAYCFGSGPNASSCHCCARCRVCFRGKCGGKSDSSRPHKKTKKGAPGGEGAALGDVSSVDNTQDRKPDASVGKANAVPLVKQSEFRVLSCTSEEAPHYATNAMKTYVPVYWKSERMTRENYREQYVEIQLDGTGARMRRVEDVEVEEHPDIGYMNDYRIDYSTDGRTWTRGPSLWGMSCGAGNYRSNMMCDIEAKFVRIVCEKKDYGRIQEYVGFASVEFNRAARRKRELQGVGNS